MEELSSSLLLSDDSSAHLPPAATGAEQAEEISSSLLLEDLEASVAESTRARPGLPGSYGTGSD
ncbi:MAG: hypothetical protein ACREJ3_07440, partial [Polyangiaceae bacterium]